MKIKVLLKPKNEVIELELEEYLRGVVPSEIHPHWSSNAIMAFTVAARTYAVHKILHPRHKPDANVCNEVHCHVYNPKKIHDKTDMYIEMTAGKILLLDGKVPTTVYSAKCGGRTKSALEGFGHIHKHLKSITCPCDIENPNVKTIGHGVGLCQWGCQSFGANMKKYGMESYEDILYHYYQNCEIGNVEDLTND